MLTITPIPALKDNYIWAIHDAAHAILVDPGEVYPALAWLNAQNLKLAAILCTHHHGDHTGGIPELAELYNVPAYGPQIENILGITDRVGEGDVIELSTPEIRLNVLHIPGHTHGHVAYVMGGNGEAGAVFCGDTLFGAGCGRLFEGTPDQLYGSLRRLASLPDDTRVYCAHEYTEANIRFALACEPHNAALLARQKDARAVRLAGLPTLPSTIGLEKATNPFLRGREAEILRILGTQRGERLDAGNEVGIFAALREWKNVF